MGSICSCTDNINLDAPALEGYTKSTVVFKKRPSKKILDWIGITRKQFNESYEESASGEFRKVREIQP